MFRTRNIQYVVVLSTPCRGQAWIPRKPPTPQKVSKKYVFVKNDKQGKNKNKTRIMAWRFSGT
jgi:hypothetical protein